MLLYRTGTLKPSECQGVRLANSVLYGGWRTGVKGGLWTDRLLSLKARALLAAVSLTTAWQRNLVHSKRRLNGPANSAATCDDRPLRFNNGGFNKALMPAQAAGLSPYNNGEGEGEGRSVEARTTETIWPPHARIANRRHGNFLLTGLGAIRNRTCVSVLPTAEIPENWRLLDEDDGN